MNRNGSSEGADLPLLKFQVITDTHITSDREHAYNRRLENALRDIAEQAPDSQGIMHAGDVTDHGFPGEYEEFRRIWGERNPSLPPLLMTMGNHDVGLGVWAMRLSNFLNATEMTGVYHDHWIGGHHFIFLGTEVGHELYCSLSEDQLRWLDEKLGEGDLPDRPVFVFLHQPPLNTVSGSLEEQKWSGVMQDAEFKAVLAKHRNRAILFTGHTHWELEAPRQYYDGEGVLPPMFNAASVAYLWTDEDKRREGSQGYFVEVYEDRVDVRGRDFENGKWVEEAHVRLRYPRD
ncbi:metallophosphoesterase family protein [Cohnella suwonensis]|uniref:Metallophosphoesterase family protein n=1 Tax=Cohnella suwonensis TaxID=696072 RepID=A0ABW0M155_9BACL